MDLQAATAFICDIEQLRRARLALRGSVVKIATIAANVR